MRECWLIARNEVHTNHQPKHGNQIMIPSPLQFDNSFMSLHAKSMSTLHHIVRLDTKASDDKNGLGVVSYLLGRPAVAAYNSAISIPSKKIKGDSKTGFFIKVDHQYFGLSYVTQSQEDANNYMLENEGCGLVATGNDDFYYLAEMRPTA
jgi:hypothetical protein